MSAVREAVCIQCGATFALPPATVGGRRSKVCSEACRERRKYDVKMGIAPSSRPTPRALAPSGEGPDAPLVSPEEVARHEEARRRRFREAVADGLDRDTLLERFPDAMQLLEEYGLRIVPHGGYPLGVPA